MNLPSLSTTPTIVAGIGVGNLVDGRVSVVVTGGADGIASVREYLEEQTAVSGLAERLKAGEVVQVLEFSPQEAEVSFPASSGGGIMVVEAGGKTWNISMVYPSSGAITGLGSGLKTARKLAKDRKGALGSAA